MPSGSIMVPLGPTPKVFSSEPLEITPPICSAR
jgi:hypothetical protein